MAITLDGTTGITTPGLTNTGTETIVSLTTTGNTTLGDATTDTLTVGVTGIVKDASGNVGIGTASPTSKLHVASAASAGNVYALIDSSGTANGYNAANLYKNSERQFRVGVLGTVGGFTNGALVVYDETAAAWRMVIDSSGNVGIGTSSPAVKLHVSGGTQRIQSTGSTSNAFLTLQNDVGTQVILGIVSSGNSPANNFYIETNAGKTIYVDTSGQLILKRTAAVNAASFVCSATQNTRAVSFVNNNNNNEVGYIFLNNDGTTTQYATSSDYRLKENISPMTSALSVIAQLKPVTYKWKINGADGQGFIAHELQAIIPDCVTGEKDGVETYIDEDGNEQVRPKYQGIDTSFLVATLTAAIQEQQALITALTARITALETP